jgi:Sulfotransferase family
MWPPDPLVFVGGSERSGTTLLRNMLTAHPELSIPNESPFTFRTYRDMARRGQEGDVALAWQLLQETSRFKQWRLPVEEVEAMLREHPPGSYADLIRSIFAAYARWRGKPHAGDKTTANALWFPWLAEQFPASRFVHVLRDPREVCMSRAVQIFNRGGIVGAAEHWRSHVAAAREAMPALGDRILEIRYEQLIAAPEEQLERLGKFLGIGFDPAMLQYGRAPDVLPQHGQDVHAREPVQTELRRWRTELARDDVSVIESIAGELMDDVGYPRELARLTPRAAITLAADWRAQRCERWLRHGAPELGAILRRLLPGWL